MKSPYLSYFLFSLCLIFLSSCEKDKEQFTSDENITDRQVTVETPLTSTYQEIGQQKQYFQIDTKTSNVIAGTNGTEIFIPANCFIDRNGQEVQGTVEIELVEVFTLTDMITSELSTTSNGDLLKSNGMIYIDAINETGSLGIKYNEKLNVIMPTITNNEKFQMFTGDGKDWQIDSSMLLKDYLIPYPLDLLYPEGNDWKYAAGWTSKPGVDKTIINYFDTLVLSLTNSKFENTVVATQEFSRRMSGMRGFVQSMSYFELEDYYRSTIEFEERKFNSEICANNLQQPIEELDVKLKKAYHDYDYNNEAKLLPYFEEINEFKRGYYGNWTDTNYFFDFRETTAEEQHLRTLDYYKHPETGKVKLINDRGVDLNSNDAYSQLMNKGVSQKEANEILAYNFEREGVLEMFRKKKKAIEAQVELYQTLKKVFSTSSLGWINCDQFYDKNYAKECEILVAIANRDKYDYIDCSMVLPSINSKISAHENENGLYTFTNKEGVYSKLPVGYNGVLIVVSVKDDKLYYGSEKLIIKEKVPVSLSLKMVSKKDLIKRITKDMSI
ncbi:MAG: hypothetical protein GQ574_21205 [Crocinitomix sp.]|nr:hypothetical protein [Crocinitomix sp.]